METKLFEIRDCATMIVVMATRMSVDDPAEEYLLERSGFGDAKSACEYVVMTDNMIERGGVSRMETAPDYWCDRTRTTAHDFIENNWPILPTGSVIDVEYILGETKTPKLSERVTSTVDGGA